MKAIRQTFPLLAILLLCSAASRAAINFQTLLPRPPASPGAAYRLPEKTEISRIVIKFHEGTHVRLRNQRLVILERNDRERVAMASRGLDLARVQADLAALHELIARDVRARGLDRLFKEDEELLATRRALGEARTGQELADLDLYYEIFVPKGTTYGGVKDIIGHLNGLASVEVAYGEPVPELPQTSTPNLQGEQGYLNPASSAPQGIDAFYAWTLPGGKGQGVNIVDVEFGWQEPHEDLPAFFYRAGTNSTDDHGTAVVGEMVGKDNGFGVTGISNQAQIGYSSVANASTAQAINSAAIGAGSPNGVVLIELHALGPSTPGSPCNCSGSQCDYIPMEYWQANFDAIATATSNGTAVVEAGGNGATNLDDAVYGRLFDRSYRDSGAILVGASESTSRTPTCFTNYGSRIDVHGWGWNVVSTGYGDRFNGGSASRLYTAVFSGTSSASPIVTGAVASILGKVRADGRAPLSPRMVRQLLRETGTPQVPDSRQIGPLPNLRQAIDTLTGRFSIFTTQTPAEFLDTLGKSWSVGNDFSSSVPGYVTHLRYYRAAEETGIHTLKLWTLNGTPLGSVTIDFGPDLTPGWEEGQLPGNGIAIQAGVTYSVTVTTTSARQSKTACGFSTPISNGPLTATGGRWVEGNGIFPTNGSCSNFWTDVYFKP